MAAANDCRYGSPLMPADTPTVADRTALSLIRDLEYLRGAACPDCGAALGHRSVLMGIALGFKNDPRCLPCLAAALGGEPTELRTQLYQYVQRQDCFREAWTWACREEMVPPDELPVLTRSTTKTPIGKPATDRRAPSVDTTPVTPPAQAGWDAGDLGCGELVLELRLRLQALPSGEMFKLCARDPGAPEDLPAWCRLTGHRLVRAEPPNYWIKRKD